MPQEQGDPAPAMLRSAAANTTPTAPRPKKVLATLVVAVLGSVLGAAAVMAAVTLIAGRGDWWVGWMTACVVSLLAAVLALAAVAPTLFGGLQTVAYGYLGAGVLRTLVTLGGCLCAVLILKGKAVPALVMAIPLYFAQLIAEAIVLGIAYRPRRNG